MSATTKSTEVATSTVAPEGEPVNDLRSLIDAIDVMGGVVADTDAALFTLIRERFAHVAQPLGRDVRGVVVLPDTVKRDVQATLWNSACGSRTPVPAISRTPGVKSFAQYLSRMTTVATDVRHGLSALENDKSARDAYRAIGNAKKSDKAAAERMVKDSAAREYLEWFDALPSGTRAAVATTVKLFTADSVGRTHADSFLAMLAIEVKASN